MGVEIQFFLVASARWNFLVSMHITLKNVGMMCQTKLKKRIANAFEETYSISWANNRKSKKIKEKSRCWHTYVFSELSVISHIITKVRSQLKQNFSVCRTFSVLFWADFQANLSWPQPKSAENFFVQKYGKTVMIINGLQ